jgi:solute carrier family 13 (sodium-dependent dicarboxylate transporter), member 2/3/5
MGVTPEIFAVPVAIAASCAFMLPVATPPAAIVYAGGRVTIREMAAAGVWINLLMFLVLTVAAMTIVGPIFGRP